MIRSNSRTKHIFLNMIAFETKHLLHIKGHKTNIFVFLRILVTVFQKYVTNYLLSLKYSL